MRKGTHILLWFILFCYPAYAQNITMSIGSVSAKSGDTVLIPINVTHYNNIGAISLSMQYDTRIMTYIGINNEPDYGNFTNNAVNENIFIGWFSNVPLTIGNGKFADLVFIYKGGYSEIEFNLSLCEIADPGGNVLPVLFNNGSIRQEIVSVKEDYKTIEFTLSQNYPNPFNSVTMISYFIPSASNVNLSVYSVTGELITELVDAFQLPGYYNVRFDSGNLTNGIFIYKIRAGQYTKSNKMLLLK